MGLRGFRLTSGIGVDGLELVFAELVPVVSHGCVPGHLDALHPFAVINDAAPSSRTEILSTGSTPNVAADPGSARESPIKGQRRPMSSCRPTGSQCAIEVQESASTAAMLRQLRHAPDLLGVRPTGWQRATV
jgi:hypothetical protein